MSGIWRWLPTGKNAYVFVVWSFFVVWPFFGWFLLLFGRGRIFVLLFGRGARPCHSPASTAKNKQTRPRPFPPCLRCTVCDFQEKCAGASRKPRRGPNSLKKDNASGGGGGRFCFCCLGGEACSFFFLFGRAGPGTGRVFFLAVWAGGAGGWALFVFLLFGRWRFLFCSLRAGFFAVWAGDGSSLTYRSAWLGFKGPNNKKDQTAKKTKHGFRFQPPR